MGDGVDGGDLGTLTGPGANPTQESCIVVDHSDSGGIAWGSDGNSYVVLPQPLRPDEDATDDRTVSG